MIPPFDPATGNLPPGIHEATWQEFVARYGYTPWRLGLLSGLKAVLDALRAAGCQRAYIDGSSVTTKEEPGDFDGCWDVIGVDPTLLDPVLLTFADRRTAQKEKYGGEMFPANAAATPSGIRYIDFFQRDRNSGPFKGLIALNLKDLP